jgi:hypothetical protein
MEMVDQFVELNIDEKNKNDSRWKQGENQTDQ